jgi:hypothetical protein
MREEGELLTSRRTRTISTAATHPLTILNVLHNLAQIGLHNQRFIRFSYQSLRAHIGLVRHILPFRIASLLHCWLTPAHFLCHIFNSHSSGRANTTSLWQLANGKHIFQKSQTGLHAIKFSGISTCLAILNLCELPNCVNLASG